VRYLRLLVAQFSSQEVCVESKFGLSSGSHLVSIVCLRIKATEFSFFFFLVACQPCLQH
jgi:hypothetical protein